MKTREDYLQELRAIKEDDWNLPKSLKADEYALELFEFLGDTDPELRDDLVLTMIWVLVDQEKVTKNTCRDLLARCMSKEGIWYRIDEEDPLAVFRRSFSQLIIATLLKDHVKSHRAWMRKDIFVDLVDQLLEYGEREKDVRGYDLEFGWAHSTAHYADALNALAACRELSEKQGKQAFQTIIEKADIAEYGYIHGEDERLARAACALVKHEKITRIDWEETLLASLQGPKTELEPYLRLQNNSNVKSFLRSLSARLVRLGMDEKWNFPVQTVLHLYDYKY